MVLIICFKAFIFGHLFSFFFYDFFLRIINSAVDNVKLAIHILVYSFSENLFMRDSPRKGAASSLSLFVPFLLLVLSLPQDPRDNDKDLSSEKITKIEIIALSSDVQRIFSS